MKIAIVSWAVLMTAAVGWLSADRWQHRNDLHMVAGQVIAGPPFAPALWPRSGYIDTSPGYALLAPDMVWPEPPQSVDIPTVQFGAPLKAEIDHSLSSTISSWRP